LINEDLIALAEQYGKFDVLVADPPWPFSNVKTGASMKSGSAQHYSTMAMEEIAALPIKHIVQTDSVAFLWVPVPLSYEIARSGIVERWGFAFKTKLFWEKGGRLGMGFWFRGQIEECWLLKRGDARPFRSSIRNVIHSNPRKHSQKPDEFFEVIELELTKAGLNNRLEIFAREPRAGWIGYGNGLVI